MREALLYKHGRPIAQRDLRIKDLNVQDTNNMLWFLLF